MEDLFERLQSESNKMIFVISNGLIGLAKFCPDVELPESGER
jgi:hypothetical protein